MSQEEPLFCVNHPTVETRLRCNRCGDPICTRCAVRTPVGYRCRKCIRQQQAIFYTGTNLDYFIAALITLPISVGAAYIMHFLGWFVFFLGPTVGVAIAELAQLAVGRRRTLYLPWVVTGSVLLGTLGVILYQVAPAVNQGEAVSFGLVWDFIYLGLVVSTVYYRVR